MELEMENVAREMSAFVIYFRDINNHATQKTQIYTYLIIF